MKAVWWILFVLYGMGCASVQRVVECTIEDRQVIADPLSDAIWDDVRARRERPSRFLRDQIQGFIVEYGLRAVRCGLRELLTSWELHGDRSLDTRAAMQIAEKLLDEI